MIKTIGQLNKTDSNTNITHHQYSSFVRKVAVMIGIVVISMYSGEGRGRLVINSDNFYFVKMAQLDNLL